MRELKVTDYSSKETDTSTMTLTLFDDGLPTGLVGDLSVVAANDDGDVKQLKYELADNRIIITPAVELPAGRYRLEVWLVNGAARAIYPSASYLYFYIGHALNGVEGNMVKVISLTDFYQQMQKIADKAVSNGVAGNFRIDDTGDLIYSTSTKGME